MVQQFFNISQDQANSDPCKDALEHIVQLLAVKFDANLTNKSEMIYDTVMSW